MEQDNINGVPNQKISSDAECEKRSPVENFVSALGRKPLGRKSYGSIPHLPGSRLGEGDHKCSDGQLKIATEKKRDKHDLIIVQEKVDGSNVGIAKINNIIIPITRAGYLANTSPYKQHHLFWDWVLSQRKRFSELLKDGERLCGEWMAQAHGTRYNLPHEPFVAFDIMTNEIRALWDEVETRVKALDFIIPKLLSKGEPFSIQQALEAIQISGHGAIDPVEGAVWRIERNCVINNQTGERKLMVDFLVKYVKPDKIDGCYLPEKTGTEPIWNWQPCEAH